MNDKIRITNDIKKRFCLKCNCLLPFEKNGFYACGNNECERYGLATMLYNHKAEVVK